MSQLVVVVNPDEAVAMICDGVSYQYDTGIVGGYASKIIAMPERNMMIGCTGLGGFGASLFKTLDQVYATFDDVVDNFAPLVRVLHRGLCMTEYAEMPPEERDLSVAVAGFSEKRQAYEAYRVVSYEKASNNGNAEPWEPLKLSGAWASAMPPKDLLDRFGVTSPPEGESMVNIGIRLVCAARANSGPGDGTRFYNAGGFVQVATLQKDQVFSYIAHRWPEDVPGRPIDPTKGEAMPAWLSRP